MQIPTRYRNKYQTYYAFTIGKLCARVGTAVLNFDKEDRSLICAGNVPQGSKIRFHFRRILM